MDVQAQQVADAVREQQRDHAVRRQLDRVAAQDAEVDEPRGERLAREHVDVAVAAARRHRGDRLLLRGQHDLVDLALRGREAAGHRPGARDVAGPAARRLGADVGEQQIAVGEAQVVALAVQDLAVRRDDRRVGAAHPARHERAPPSPRAPRAAAASGTRRAHAGGVRRRGRRGRQAQLGARGVVVVKAQLDDRVRERRIEHVDDAAADVAAEQAALLQAGLDVGRGQRRDGAAADAGGQARQRADRDSRSPR